MTAIFIISPILIALMIVNTLNAAKKRKPWIGMFIAISILIFSYFMLLAVHMK